MIELPIIHKQFHNIQSIGLYLFRVFIFLILLAQSSAYSMEGGNTNTTQRLISIAVLPYPPAEPLSEDPAMIELEVLISRSYFDRSRGFSECQDMYDFYASHHLEYYPMNAHQLEHVQQLISISSDLIHVLSQADIDVESVKANLYSLYQVAYYHVYYHVLGIINLMRLPRDGTIPEHFYESHMRGIGDFENREDIQEFLQSLFRVTSDYPAFPSKVWYPTMSWSFWSEFSVDMSPYAQAIFDLVSVVNQETCQSDPSRAKGALEQFLARVKKQEHFDKWVAPLLQLQIGIQYLERKPNLDWIRQLWRLIGLVIQEKIPYELKEPNYKKNQATDDPAMQMRMHLYLELPFAEMCVLAIQVHDTKYPSGGAFILSDQNLVNMTNALRTVLPSISALIDFEIDVVEGRALSGNTTNPHPDLEVLKSFGSHYQDIQNLSKIREYLNYCLEDKNRLMNTPVGRYAIIRALEVIGEVGKKLSPSTKNTYPAFWKQMAKIRDYFSHLSDEGNAYLRQAIYRMKRDEVFAGLTNNLEAILGHVNYVLERLAHAGPDRPDLKDSSELLDLLNFLTFLKIASSQEDRLKYQILAKEEKLRQVINNKFNSASSTMMVQADFEGLVDRLWIDDGNKNKLKKLYRKYSNQNGVLLKAEKSLLDSILKLKIQKKMGEILSKVYQAPTWEDALKWVSSWDNEELQLLKSIYDSRRNTPEVGCTARTLSLRKARNAIPEISQVILQLSMITKLLGRSLESLNNDLLLYMACEHLISLFRDNASKILKSIFWVKTHTVAGRDHLSERNKLLNDLMEFLHDAIINANAILHHHDATEIPLFSADGYRWMMSEQVQRFLGCIEFFPKQIRTYQRLLEALLGCERSSQSSAHILGGTLEDNTVLSFTERTLPADNNCGFHGIGVSREDAVAQLMNATSDPRIRSLVVPDIFAAFQSEFMALDSLNLPNSYRDHIQALAQARYDAQLKIDVCLRAINDILEPFFGYRMDLTKIMEALKNGGLDVTHVRDEYKISLNYFVASILRSYREEQSLEDELREYSEDESVYRSFVSNYSNPTQWLSYVRGATGVLDALAELNNLSIYVWTPDASNPAQLHLTHRTAIRSNPARTIHLIHRDGLTHFNALDVVVADPSPVAIVQPAATLNDTPPEDGSYLIPLLTKASLAGSK